MHIGLIFAFSCVLLISIETANGNDLNKTKTIADNFKNYDLKSTSVTNRNKRSLDDKAQNWPNRGKRFSVPENISKIKSNLGRNVKFPNNDKLDKESPFWGSRGRRNSASIENNLDESQPLSEDSILYSSNCEYCLKPFKDSYDDKGYQKERREEQQFPFRGNRGRRNSDESDDISYDPRGQEEDPFWGARGRREDEIPFWGNRGRRYNWAKQGNDEDPPFWGNRGRRDEIDPFWGSRGRRQEPEPFWKTQSKENKNDREENLKQVLHDAINTVEDNIESLTRIRKDSTYAPNSFWGSRGRDSRLFNLFKLGRDKIQMQKLLEGVRPESNTIHDDRIFAEQPRFILVERSSRSSSEGDPFFISRGKKMRISYEPSYSSRARRGSIEELVKSVRNDPYYIARGKKDVSPASIGNSTTSHIELGKAQDLICATIDLVLHNKGSKKKREVDDIDRDRRTILKKLAAQLQIDPYFVSRGKKNQSDFSNEILEDFINEVSMKCN